MSIEHAFPNLAAAGYRVTSPASKLYNCIAWAAGDDGQWWEPIAGPGYYWPKDGAWEYTMNALVQVFIDLGFSVCDDAELETGFEKVALFGFVDGYTHAARQLSDGKWTSKLGPLEDIEHNNLNCLEGAEYGSVVQIMKRPILNEGRA